MSSKSALRAGDFSPQGGRPDQGRSETLTIPDKFANVKRWHAEISARPSAKA
jgi:hypothetical protein